MYSHAMYLDSGLRQVEGGGQLAAFGSGDVVLLAELLLQLIQLLPGEGRTVSPHVTIIRART